MTDATTPTIDPNLKPGTLAYRMAMLDMRGGVEPPVALDPDVELPKDPDDISQMDEMELQSYLETNFPAAPEGWDEMDVEAKRAWLMSNDPPPKETDDEPPVEYATYPGGGLVEIRPEEAIDEGAAPGTTEPGTGASPAQPLPPGQPETPTTPPEPTPTEPPAETPQP